MNSINFAVLFWSVWYFTQIMHQEVDKYYGNVY